MGGECLCGEEKHCVSLWGCVVLVYEGTGSLFQMKHPWMGTWLAVCPGLHQSDLVGLAQVIWTAVFLFPG